MRPLRIATRGSALAVWQAEHIAARLDRPAELVVVDTTADRRLDVPIWSLGGKGAFVKEVQAALLDGRVVFDGPVTAYLTSEAAGSLR